MLAVAHAGGRQHGEASGNLEELVQVLRGNLSSWISGVLHSFPTQCGYSYKMNECVLDFVVFSITALLLSHHVDLHPFFWVVRSELHFLT